MYFLSRVDPFLDGYCCTGKWTGIKKKCLPFKNGESQPCKPFPLIKAFAVFQNHNYSDYSETGYLDLYIPISGSSTGDSERSERNYCNSWWCCSTSRNWQGKCVNRLYLHWSRLLTVKPVLRAFVTFAEKETFVILKTKMLIFQSLW